MTIVKTKFLTTMNSCWPSKKNLEITDFANYQK